MKCRSTVAIRSLSIVAVIVCKLASLSPAWGDDWLFDPQAAIAKATQEKKDLLFLFTGSDWCPPCKKLEEEVFAIEGFWPAIQGDYVAVKLDFLRNSPMPPETSRMNDEWAGRFGIAAFPTMVIADHQLRPVGFLGYVEGGLEPFIGQLESMRNKRMRRDAAFDEAAKVTGLDRARLLDAGLSELPEEIARLYYEELVEEVIALDAEDELGLRTKWNAPREAELRRIMMTDILTLSRLEKPEKVVAFIDEVLAEFEFPLEEQFSVLLIKLSMLQRAGQLAEAQALLDTMAALDGVTASSRERLMARKALLVAGTDGIAAALQLVDQMLQADDRQLHLALTKVQLLARSDEHQRAIDEADRVLAAARFEPDLRIELVAAKAESLCAMQRTDEALQILEEFSEDQQMPVDLRCEAMLQQAMIMRETGRTRPATMKENRAINTADQSDLKREINRVVEQLQKRFGQ